jgi:hypothetical protein
MFNNFVDSILRNLWRSVIIAVVALVVIFGLLWWVFIWQSPQRVFSDMLANNLSVTSVTKHIAVSSSSQSVDQYVRLEMGSTNASEWLVTVAQSNTSVTSDSIATPTTAYIRYTQIKDRPKTQKIATNLDKVLNLWGRADGKTDPNLGQLFSQSLLDIGSAPIPPIGNVSDTERQALVNYMLNQGVFSGIYNKVTSQTINGHGVYTYHVLVYLGPYVRLMQSFAHALGNNSLNSINPSQYSNATPVALTLSVDKMSHDLEEVVYPATGYAQSYADWGLLTPIVLPHHTISTTALQTLIQALK